MAAGRPTKYTPELGKLICERIATNPIGWSTLEKLYPDMPTAFTIRAWRNSILEFSTLYLQAKSFQAQILVEEIDDLLPSEIKYYHDDKGNERIDAPSASMLIAKINNRKWMAARLSPKIYGDKQTIETTSATENDMLKAEIASLRSQLDSNSKRDY